MERKIRIQIGNAIFEATGEYFSSELKMFLDAVAEKMSTDPAATENAQEDAPQEVAPEKPERVPFVCNVKEIMHKNVIVYAKDKYSAQAEALRQDMNGKIDFDDAEVQDVECDMPEEIDGTEVGNYEDVFVAEGLA